jgi:meso-butanediol dehydrogenase/(S,S)-butanediol dehydrogenase/diacetyl reductase
MIIKPETMDKIAGKTVLITGSSSGLGRQLARAFLREEAQVIINGRHKEKLLETEQYLRTIGSNVVSVTGDITLPEDCRRMISACIKKFGKLDILVNNAGTGANGLFRDTVPEASKIVLETNLFGSIYTTYYALPHILESRGSIIFISSLAGIHGLPYNFSYCASKMALTALGQSLRIELSGSGVHTGIMYIGFLENIPEKKIIGNNGQLIAPPKKPERFTMSLEKASMLIIKSIKKRQAVKVFTGMGKFIYQANRISPLFIRKAYSRSMNRLKLVYTPV